MARRESNRVIVRRGLKARKARKAFTLWVLFPAHTSATLAVAALTMRVDGHNTASRQQEGHTTSANIVCHDKQASVSELRLNLHVHVTQGKFDCSDAHVMDLGGSSAW